MEWYSAWWKLELDQVEEGSLRSVEVRSLDRKKRWHRWQRPL